MSWLHNNSIINLSGPEFLLFYAVVAAAVLAAVWCGRRRLEQEDSSGLPLPELPEEPDPYAVAYLRGGLNEVTRLVIFDLLRRNLLKIETAGTGIFRTKEERIVRNREVSVPEGELTDLESDVYRFFATPRTVSDVFAAAGGLPERIGHHCLPYEEVQNRERLLTEPGARRRMRLLMVSAWVFLDLLAVWKVVVAISRGHSNVLFLIFLSLAATFGVVVAARPGRLSARGRNYLERMRLAWWGPGVPVRAIGEPSTLPLIVALYGFTVLSNTSYGDYNTLFQRRAGADGCGGEGCGISHGADSCGSAGCGSGGCGSGGSGCGGSGCGGCSGGGH